MDEKQRVTAAIFTRNATGLVREASGLDASIYNLMWSSIPLASVFIFSYGVAYYVGANLYISILLCALLCLPTAILYSMMSNAMPRSGADYVWVSRSVHPLLGFMSNWNFVIWMLYFIGVYSTLLANYGISSVLRVIAAFTNSPQIMYVADLFVKPAGVFVIGIVLVLLSGVMFIFGRGLKTFMRVLRWGFLFYLVGGILLPIVVVFVASRGFPELFNHYMSGLNIGNAYQKIVEAGAFSPPSTTDWQQTILAMTIPYYVFGNIFQSAYFAGEIKRGRGVHTWSMPGTLVIATILMLLLTYAFEKGIGNAFLGAVTLAPADQVGYAFSPTYAELAAISSGNLIIGLIIVLGLAANFLFWVPQTIVIISRSLFAWSFDGLVSQKVSDVSEKTHSPTVAVSIIVFLSCVSVALVAFVPGLTALVGLLGLTITLLSVSLAGILFPFRQADTWKGSAFNRRILGVPTVTLFGILSFVFMLIMAWVLLNDPNSGTSWEANRNMVYIVLIIYLSAIPFYFISKWLQSAKGIDISLAYKEIPPE